MKTATTEQLIEKFKELSVTHGELKNVKAANRAFDEAVKIWVQIAHRGTHAIESFSRLLESDNAIIRLSAASKLLFIMPQRAEAVLDKLTTEPPWTGFTAKMTLTQWREGKLKPLI
jgi:hypothetical protein